MARGSTSAAFAIFVVTLITVSCDSRSAGDVRDVLVVVVESRAGGADLKGLAYSATVGESKLTDAASIMDTFRAAHSPRLAILVSEDVPIGVVPNLLLMASKTIRNVETRLFIVGDGRTGMMTIPEFKWVDFSTDPVVVGEYFD